MSRWFRRLSLFLVFGATVPVLAVRSQPEPGPGPKVIPQYRVKVEAKDNHGNAVPATVAILAVKTKFTFQKSLGEGPLVLNLRSGDQYEIVASLDGYQTVRKTIRLERLGDPARTNLLVTMELPIRRVPVQVTVVDDRTGKSLQNGFWMKTEDGDPNQFTESHFVSESPTRMFVEPGTPARVVVKAEGYAIQSHEISDGRTTGHVTIRLRPVEEWAMRPYSVRVLDSDYHHLSGQYKVQIRDEALQIVPLQFDPYTSDWKVMLRPRGRYTIEVEAGEYLPYRDTLRNVPQTTILVMLHRRATPADLRQSLTVLDPNGRKLEVERPDYYARWVEQLYPVGKPLAGQSGRADQALLTLDRVYFAQGKATLRDEASEQLRQLADLLKNYPNLKVKIAGHTDRVGDPRLNLFLSDSRAGAVQDFLLKQGVDPRRIRFEGYGHSRPVAPSDTEENRQKNRRVEIWVLEK